MNTNPLHEEENFWPSVSDMFLSFFVIALALAALYHNSHKKDGESLDYAYKQRVEAILNLTGLEGRTYEPSDDAKAQATRPAMAELLCDALDKIEHDDNKRKHNQRWLSAPADRAALVEARKDYTLALPCFGHRLGLSFEENQSALAMLDAVLVAIQQRKAQETERPRSVEELQQEIDNLRRRLETKRRKIKEQERRLKQTLPELQAELSRQLRMLEEKEAELARLRAQLGEASNTIGQLRGTIDALSKDNRRDLMGAIRTHLAAYGIPVVQEGDGTPGVILDAANAILRIPSTVVSFRRGSAIPRQHEADILAKVARFLHDLAVANGNKESDWNIYNMIDNIVIESHCDSNRFTDEVDGREMDGNEILSSNRALVVWDIMQKAHPLADFRNMSGKGLFSHAGFGSRVLLPKREGEEKNAHDERCRRIDIRFNCTAEATRQQSQPNNNTPQPRP